MKRVAVGCSGWAYREWRGSFYPEKLPQRKWLSAYAERFDTVEVNNTFYRLPSSDAVRGWIAETPAGFRFTIKGSRYFTHIKRMLSPEKYVTRFYESIEPLAEAGKLDAVLWQLPPSSKQDLGRLEGALSVFAGKPGRACFEFRHPSWFKRDTYELLRAHDAALVIADNPEWPFQAREVTASWAYVRLHRGSKGTYTKTELDTWRRRIAAWRSRVEVLAYFNNDEAFAAPQNAASLAASLS